MMYKKNPITPHLQVYKWNVSSLLSISHRIVGVMNILAISLICLWVVSLSNGQSDYQSIQLFFKSIYGKFLIITLCWSFSFHILNEVRHLAWDLGYGFNLKVSKITGIITILGSFLITVLTYITGKA